MATDASSRSYTPYSGRNEGVIILLEDGSTVKGVRVENASFSLTITALQNAVSTLHSIGRVDMCAVVSSAAFTDSDLTYAGTMPNFEWDLVAEDVMVVSSELPEPNSVQSPLLPDWGPEPNAGVLEAREVSELAYTPESDFPVGCVIRTDGGYHIPGVNVEHPDWSQILCAERNALSSMVAYGLGKPVEIFVSCPKEPGGSPCGACRQVIAELAPDATIWIDQGEEAPTSKSAELLLPGYFTGTSLRGS